MNRREAAEEPSMEDILASIRKIIADEPASAAPPLPLPQLSPVGFPLPSKDATSATPSPSQTSLSARLNDVFGPGSIVPGDRIDARQPNTPTANPSATKTLSPLRPTMGRSAMDDDLGDLLADTPAPTRTPEPGPQISSLTPRRPAMFDLSATDALSARGPAAATPYTQIPDRAPQASPLPPSDQASPSLASEPVEIPRAALEAQAKPSAPTGPVVIAAMPVTPQPAPTNARPAMFPTAIPAASPPTPVEPIPALDIPVVTPSSPAATTIVAPLPSRPEPIVIASSKPAVASMPAPAAPVVIATAHKTSDPKTPDLKTSELLTSELMTPEPLTPEPLKPAPVVIAQPPSGIIQPSTLDFLRPVTKPDDDAPPKPQIANTLAPVEPAPAAPAAPAAPSAPVVIAAPPAATIAPSAPNAEPVAAVTAPMPAVIPSQTVAAEPAPLDADEAVASALGALAAGLAASAKATAPEIIVTAVEVKPPRDETSPLAASTSKPSAPNGVSVFSSPDSFVSGTALKPVSTSTLDDTAAELLRPMLRQWLDDNMPRIVERALRIELADTVDITPKADPKP